MYVGFGGYKSSHEESWKWLELGTVRSQKGHWVRCNPSILETSELWDKSLEQWQAWSRVCLSLQDKLWRLQMIELERWGQLKSYGAQMITITKHWSLTLFDPSVIVTWFFPLGLRQ